MRAKLSIIICKWLQGSDIKVSYRYLDHLLQSHPDYPSLASITDTLDELYIDNLSLVVDKKKLDQLPVPFLAHSPGNGGEFIVVNNIDQQIKRDNEVEKNWDGIVVLAEKPVNWYHAENENALIKEKASRKQATLALASIVLLAIFSLFNHLSVSLAGLLLASMAGLGIAVLIVQQELGISNEITEQLCNAGKETDCFAVINSKGSKLSKWFKWTDAGIIYFSSFLLLLIASPTNPLLSLVSVLAMPFIFFSVYYQWRVVKKWCTLCLLTISILIVQFILLSPVALNLIMGEKKIFTVDSLSFSAYVFTSIAAIWLLIIKPALQKNKELTDKNYSLLRFKNNPDIFNALLRQQRKVNTIPFENDLQLGNPKAPIQIMVACNPYCGPCAIAHEMLHEMVEKNDIGLTVRFTIKADQPENKKTKIVEHILQHLVEAGDTAHKSRKILHDWFAAMDHEKFCKVHPVAKKTDVYHAMKRQEDWTVHANITATPTIFINGYELPKQYRIGDLKRVISEEKETKAGKIEEPETIIH